jgi:hypothetical protein
MTAAFFKPLPGSHETPIGRATKALLLGALTGAVLACLLAYRAPVMALMIFPMALLVWLAGLFLLAAPVWAVLHLTGQRSLLAAVLLGTVMTAAAGAVLWTSLTGSSDAEMSPGGVATVAAFALSGAAVATVVWRKAYLGRVGPLRHPFSRSPGEEG